jgi:spermidine synthase
VIGLGTGTIAAWGQAGDYIRFYELNPTIIQLATDPNGYFTYLSDSSAKVDVVEGDARISIENELREGHPQHFDVLVLDAFSADAIPMHLLTREAMRTWLAAITPDGVIAVHISNRFLNLNPVLAALAHNYNLHSGWIHHNADTEHADTPSDWVLLSRNNKVLSIPAIAQQMKPIDTNKSVLWTDNYSNLFSVLQ